MITTSVSIRSERGRRMPVWPAVVLAGWLGLSVRPPPCAASGGEIDFGFLFFRGADLDGSERVTAAGPVYEARRVGEEASLLAVRPFYSAVEERARGRRLQEFLWPVGTIKKFKGETSWRFLVAYGTDFDRADSDTRYRFVVFPVFFQGRDIEDRPYLAVFPLGGRIREYLGQDEITFVLFPLYAHHRVGDSETHSLLWPVVSWSSSASMKKFRIFPLYGQSRRRERWVKRFVLWPVWTSVRYLDPEKPGGGFVLFPLYGHVKAGEKHELWMLIPPLFRFSRGGGHRELNAPWPLVQYASGEYEKLYVWPLWGRKDAGAVRSWFCAWPIVSGKTVTRKACTIERFAVLPFFQHEKRIASAGDPAEGGEGDERPSVPGRSLKLWPLLDYRREGDRSEMRALALWPFMSAESVERNYSAFWTLYSRRRSGAERDDELLWGLARWRRDGRGNRDLRLFPLFSEAKQSAGSDVREWRILLGLAGYRREGLRKTYRLLYVMKWKTGDDRAEQ